MYSLPSPCYVFSDAHIGGSGGDGNASLSTERNVLAFLDSLRGRAGSVLVNGDLLDFWFEWRHVVPRSGFHVVAALAALARSGTSVLWVAGNHDGWGSDVLREAGITFVDGPWRGDLAGWRAHVDHGDGLRGQEDRGYRALRRVLRNRWAIRAFRFLHPDWGTSLARGSAHASRTYRAPDDGVGLREVARRLLERDAEIDIVVFGHSHVAALDAEVAHGVYANAGEWIVEPTFLRVTPERVELLRWTLREEVVVRAIERVALARVRN
ncbi:MAG: UDP-2,3-diacylglucosamine diphosphatase [Gemmatimonadaceae bacterium]